jgi:putative ubiquitin-RnfH superfamily antitoxin RatB of RatAB toxin-antitoxin module
MAPADSPDEAIPQGPVRVQVTVGVAPREVRVVTLTLPEGSTVRDALHRSGLLTQVAGLSEESIAAGQWTVAVWGRRERAGHVLRDQDRIEVVRGLQVDPKESRRARYRAQGEKLPRGVHRAKSGLPRTPG